MVAGSATVGRQEVERTRARTRWSRRTQLATQSRTKAKTTRSLDFARDRGDLVGDWLFQISHANHFDIDGRDPSLILVDSGCYHHCCPHWFAPHVATVATEKQSASAANKQPLMHYGKKAVPGWLADDHGHRSRAEINFKVFDVQRPRLSGMVLAGQGFDIQHTAKQHVVMKRATGCRFSSSSPARPTCTPWRWRRARPHHEQGDRCTTASEET